MNKFKKYPSNNSYIKIHQKKMIDDERYKLYLEWCKEKGQLAMDKNGFEELRNQEKEFYESFKKMGIS